MARTKAKAKRGPEGREYRENAKTAEGRKLNLENKKLKQHSRKATKAAKRAQITKNNDTPPDNHTKDEETNKQDAQNETRRVEEGNDSIQSNAEGLSKHNTSSEIFSINTTSVIIDHNLVKSYEVTTMSIISSSHIQQKVTRALSLLSVYPIVPPAKPSVVLLHAKAKVAAKMVSIAEIVKREIGSMDGKWFQYNVVEQIIEEQKESAGKENNDRKGKGKGKGVDGDEEMGDRGESEEEEEAFETMKTPFERAIEGTAKVRAVPIMSIYMSRVRVESLRREYGEQTNGLEVSQQ